tara:strand:- start:72 stop:386 length:315 start_codon:yes stop_codon:yes gene_type:complete
MEKLQKHFRKDYFFLVINKNDPTDIIINSILGLKEITPNINNLPFQIMWKNNRNYNITSNDDLQKTIIRFVKNIIIKVGKKSLCVNLELYIYNVKQPFMYAMIQ